MTDLVQAADLSNPANTSAVPAMVKIILGYVGQHGCTPTVWTPAQAKAAEAGGRLFAPIWTPPQSTFNAEVGKQSANAMAAVLPDYGYPKAGPVFLDIERSTWDRHPPITRAGVTAWQSGMAKAGWKLAIPYLPTSAGYGWVADWTNRRPGALPDGWFGQQYAGQLAGDRYDLSVFRSSVFEGLINYKGVDVATWDNDDKAYLVAQLTAVQNNIGRKLSAYQWDNDKANPEPVANTHLSAKLDQLLSRQPGAGTGSIDVDELAAAVTKSLAPLIGAAVATELAKRLAQ